jgi:hypothetical protein
VPIRPENLHRYPPDWQDVRQQVLTRANHRCEGSPAFPYCHVPNGAWRNNETGDTTERAAIASEWKAEGWTVVQIVLTIGHLDHQPENCSLTNLRAWCQRCHLTYDAKHHAATAYRTRRAGKAKDMFE